jgi:hypothetical protein
MSIPVTSKTSVLMPPRRPNSNGYPKHQQGYREHSVPFVFLFRFEAINKKQHRYSYVC